jgi:hypothetical protein
MADRGKLTEKISIAKCKEILNRKGKNYSEEDLLAIRELLFELAKIDYDVFIYNEQKERNFKQDDKNNNNDFKTAA